jgi:hypothetical protein
MRQLILLTVLVSSFSAHALDERARKLLSVKEWVAEFELSAQGSRTLTATKQSMRVKLSASGSARVVLKPVNIGPESGGFDGEGTGT